MKKNNFTKTIDALPELHGFHNRCSKTYDLLNSILEDSIDNLNLTSKDSHILFEQYGKIIIPYYQMGAVSSLNLFGLDEFIIFAYYWRNRNNYRNVADIGANIGLHSIILSRCGYNVTSYEPDPIHFKILKQNLKLNEIKNAKLINAAVSDKDGFSNFVRVIGNSTSSHLEGSKDNAYGDLEKFEVKTIHIDSVFKDIDFIKMDVEGAEGKIILSTGSEHWATTEMLLEVGNEKNASVIFSHLKKIGINAFSQKNGWAIVKTLDDFPKSYKEGSLFISNKDYMSWL